MVITLVCFDSGFQEFIKIIIIGISVVFETIIVQITKMFKVLFEIMDAFDLVTVVTSLEMLEELKGRFPLVMRLR